MKTLNSHVILIVALFATIFAGAPSFAGENPNADQAKALLEALEMKITSPGRPSDLNELGRQLSRATSLLESQGRLPDIEEALLGPYGPIVTIALTLVGQPAIPETGDAARWAIRVVQRHVRSMNGEFP